MPTKRKTEPEEPIEEQAGTAGEAMREGAAAGAEAAAAVWPAVAKATSKTVYGTCYYLAYGATFGALSLASLVPKDSLLQKGFHDGAEAAREVFHEHETSSPEATAEEAAEAAPAQ
jgi:hypothetical protein